MLFPLWQDLGILVLKFCVCIHVCAVMCVCLCVRVSVCVCLCRGHRTTSGVTPQVPSNLYFDTGSFAVPGIICEAGLAGQEVTCLHLPAPGGQDCATVTFIFFNMDSGKSNSGSSWSQDI